MNIFEVTPDDIERLNDTDLRILIGYLAEYEMTRQGLSNSSVTYGGHQNAKDGGIDVRVETYSLSNIGYIPRRNTGFQVKAEDLPAGEIEKEMRPGGQLREAINDLADRGGSYIIVSSKGAVSDTALKSRKDAMSRAARSATSADKLHVDFYDKRRIASWVNSNPGLVAWLRSKVGRPIAGWRPFGDWSSSPLPAEEEYLADDKLRLISPDSDPGSTGVNVAEGINKVRQVLRQRHGVVRLTGLSGVGKTRLVQALFDDRVGQNALAPHSCVYTDISDGPDPQPVELCSWLGDMGRSCVIIVDNCGVALHQKLASRIRTTNADLSIITVEYDVSDDEPEYTSVFRLEPSSSELIVKLLERKYPGLTSPELNTISSFSEGNSRIAFALADTSRRGDSLANLKDSELFKRLFRQNNEDDPQLLRAAKTISLVYSFDVETLDGTQAELPILASLAGQTVSQLHGNVAELKRRQLVQKRSKWRALLPHALAHRLAKQALQDIPRDVLLDHLIPQAPERLIRSFSKRLGCLHDAPEAQSIAASWLSKDGWLGNVPNLNDFGTSLFENVAPINLDATLSAIERAVPYLLPHEDHEPAIRRHVRMLRLLAYEPRHFDRALSSIVALTPNAERTNNTSDSINVFRSLFHLYLSGTHAGPTQRAEFLRSLAQSSSAKEMSLAIVGIAAMFKCDHFSSNYSFEFGTRKRDYGFQPEERQEIRNWFKAALDLCQEFEQIDTLKLEVRALLAREFSSLIRAGVLDDLTAVASAFNRDGGWPEGWAGARKGARMARKAKRDDDAEKLRKLAEELKPTSLTHRIASYVLAEPWTNLDLAEIDDTDDDQRIKRAQEAVDRICRDIGHDLAADHSALVANIRPMIASRSHRIFTVATALGETSSDPDATWRILISELACSNSDRSGTFLAAFVFGVSKQNESLAEKIRSEMYDCLALHPFVVRIETFGGLSQTGVARIKSAFDMPTVPTISFLNLAYGRTTDSLAAADFRQIIEKLLERSDGGLDVAVEIMEMRIHSSQHDEAPLEPDHMLVGKELLLRIDLTKDRKKPGADPLAKIVETCVAAHDAATAQTLCSKLLSALTDFRISAYDYGSLIGALCERFPHVVLDILVERNDSTIETPRLLFRGFREGRACPFDKIDDEVLLSWARERPQTRFAMLAEIVRPWRGRTEDDHYDEARDVIWTSISKHLLQEAPDPVEIVTSFLDRIYPSGWSGSLADILQGRLPLVRELQRDPRPEVAAKATEAAERLVEAIEANRQSEARENRARDERFDW